MKTLVFDSSRTFIFQITMQVCCVAIQSSLIEFLFFLADANIYIVHVG